jgi:hypothetical protein
MQEEIRRYAERLRADGRAPIQIRVGVNTGEVVVRSITTGVDQVEYTPIGHTTNLASRMQALAGSPGWSLHARRLSLSWMASFRPTPQSDLRLESWRTVVRLRDTVRRRSSGVARYHRGRKTIRRILSASAAPASRSR